MIGNRGKDGKEKKEKGQKRRSEREKHYRRIKIYGAREIEINTEADEHLVVAVMQSVCSR